MTNRIERYPAWLHAGSGQVDLNRVGLTMLIGFATGLSILGGGLRMAMRLVALIAGVPPAFTPTGTILILLLGCTLGVILGLLYGLAERWLPLRWWEKGSLFGLPLALLTALPFMVDPDGEFAIVASWIGIGLFTPLLLLFSLAMAYGINRMTAYLQRAIPRRVSLLYFTIFMAILGWTFINLMELGESTRTPSLVGRWLEELGVAFHQIREVQSMLTALFVVLFCGLHMASFCRTGSRLTTTIICTAQLIAAAILIRAEPLLPLPEATNAGSTIEWLAWGICLIALALWYWQWGKGIDERNDTNAFTGFVGTWLLMWLAVLLLPGLQLRGMSAFQTTLSVTPLLWPWLVLPLMTLAFHSTHQPAQSIGCVPFWGIARKDQIDRPV